MTFRNCVIMQSHLDTLLHVARDDPAFRDFTPLLEELLDRTWMIKRTTTEPPGQNIIRHDFNRIRIRSSLEDS